MSEKPTRVLLLTQWFDPEPTPKGLAFAKELVKSGLEVEVLTGFPNYPSGRVYPGYKLKVLHREIIEGVQVTRVPLYPSHDKSVFRRALNYATFAVSAMLYGLFRAERPDVIYAYHPPPTVGLVAVVLRAFRRVPVLYDIQDLWPDTLAATGMLRSRWILKLIGWMCALVYRHVDKIVVLSTGFREILMKRGVPASKLSVIYNWADESSLSARGVQPVFSREGSPFRIIFAGNHGRAQALHHVLDAAELLQNRKTNVEFAFIGDGIDKQSLVRDVVERNIGNVEFKLAVPMSEIGSVLAEGDALLVHLRLDPLFDVTIPSKTQAYMAAGKPIIMVGRGDAADLVRNAKAGVVVEPERPDQLADAIETMLALDDLELKEMGDRAYSFYEENLSLSIGASSFAGILRGLAVSWHEVQPS